MVKTIAQLRREIARERSNIQKEIKRAKSTGEVKQLKSELFRLKNRGLFKAGEKARRIGRKLSKSGEKIFKKAAPLVQKQAKLIREQQLREDALERKRLRGTKITKGKAGTKLVPVKVRGGKVLFKKVKVKSKPKKVSSSPHEKPLMDSNVFAPLDF
ncbi:MAG: hypothetical protein ACTSQ4_02170 [Candidatus Heimdallarchaeaceae archaeon]